MGEAQSQSMKLLNLVSPLLINTNGKWKRKQGLQCQNGSASGLSPQSIAVYHCIRGLVVVVVVVVVDVALVT